MIFTRHVIDLQSSSIDTREMCCCYRRHVNLPLTLALSRKRFPPAQEERDATGRRKKKCTLEYHTQKPKRHHAPLSSGTVPNSKTAVRERAPRPRRRPSSHPLHRQPHSPTTPSTYFAHTAPGAASPPLFFLRAPCLLSFSPEVQRRKTARARALASTQRTFYISKGLFIFHHENIPQLSPCPFRTVRRFFTQDAAKQRWPSFSWFR